MAAKNANDGLGLLKVVENATNDVTDMLQRIRELAVQAQSGTNSQSDIDNLQLEANALIDEIGRVSEDTTYNNTAYLGSGASTTINIQVGYNDGDTITLQTYNIKAENLGVNVTDESGAAGDTVLVALKNADGTYLQLDQMATAATTGTTDRVPGALEVITAAIDQVASYKAEWGAGQNRLEYTVSNLMNVVEFTTAAQSRIQDADFAVEAARLAKAQVLQQTGTAMLAQANAAPQIALQLLK
jgi:flagellin